VLIDAACLTFGRRGNSRYNGNKPRRDKPWFDKECKTLRKKILEAKRQFKKQKSPLNKAHYHHISKMYKKCIDKHIKNYKTNLTKLFRGKCKHSPKEYWSMLNKKNSTNSDTAPDLNSFYCFYRELNKTLPNLIQMT